MKSKRKWSNQALDDVSIYYCACWSDNTGRCCESKERVVMDGTRHGEGNGQPKSGLPTPTCIRRSKTWKLNFQKTQKSKKSGHNLTFLIWSPVSARLFCGLWTWSALMSFDVYCHFFKRFILFLYGTVPYAKKALMFAFDILWELFESLKELVLKDKGQTWANLIPPSILPDRCHPRPRIVLRDLKEFTWNVSPWC